MEESSDPFRDSSLTGDLQCDLGHLTLNVGRSASFTLGADSLIVFGTGLHRSGKTALADSKKVIPLQSYVVRYAVALAHQALILSQTASERTCAIPYFNVLWASLTKAEITIQYAQPAGKVNVRVTSVTQPLDPLVIKTESAKAWVAQLFDRAYGESQRQKRIKVLTNPFSGAGRASELYNRDIKPIFTAARCQVDEQPTCYRNHATEITEKIDINAYDVIAACSGDGIPHEVFNGLGRKPNALEALRKLAVVQLPCGTGNAMSWNLNGTGSCSMAALAIVKGIRTPLDLVSVTQGQERVISFLSQAIGIIAETDLGTENVRWMGSARITYGLLLRLLGKTVYPCDVAVKTEIADKDAIREHYRTALSERHQNLKLQASSSSSTSSHQNQNEENNGTEDTTAITTSTTSSSQPSTASQGGGLPPLKYGTVSSPLPQDWTLTPYPTLGNFYSGNMAIMAESARVFPASLPSDGLLDLITIDGNIGRLKAIASLHAVENGTLFDMPHVRMRKVTAFRVVPRFGKWATSTRSTKSTGDNSSSSSTTTTCPTSQSSSSAPQATAHKHKSRIRRLVSTCTASTSSRLGGIRKRGGVSPDGGFISVDGEKMPFEPFQVEVHRGLGTVLSRSGCLYEALGPKGWETADTVSTTPT